MAHRQQKRLFSRDPKNTVSKSKNKASVSAVSVEGTKNEKTNANPTTISNGHEEDTDNLDIYDFSGVPFDLEALRSEIFSYSDRLLQQSKRNGGGGSKPKAVYHNPTTLGKLSKTIFFTLTVKRYMSEEI